MHNPYQTIRDMLAPGVRQIGVVTAAADGSATVELLPGGGTVRVLGQASVSDKVYIRDGVIEGPAPDLPIVTGEV